MSLFMRSTICRKLVALAVVVTLSGCAIPARELETAVPAEVLASRVADKPEVLHPYYAVLLQQGPRNSVLNHMRIGLASLDTGAYSTATESLDEALQGVEAIYADNEAAARAREIFTRESHKDFKGEPYERAMLYYYRGLLYLREGDYENARASFKSGMLQDAFAEESQHRADFALLAFLEGWASQCRGDQELARRSFAEASTIRPEIVPPATDHNLLLLAESGTAPVKYGDGPNRSLLRYRRGSGFDETSAIWSVDGRLEGSRMIEDVYWQASTRGGRPVDYILARKVTFKENAATTGRVMQGVGMTAMLGGMAGQNQYATMAGGVILAIGLLSQAASDAARPEADARYWDNLPDSVHVLTTLVPAERTSHAKAWFLDGSGTPVVGLEREVEVKWAGACGVAFARSRSGVPAELRAPNSVTR